MPFSFNRHYATSDSIQVINGNQSWDISKPSDVVADPTRLWLNVEGYEEARLMEYNWDTNEWTDVTPA